MSAVPCLSVVIPTFNMADLLPTTLEYLLDLVRNAGLAAGKDVEIIVVDDGSTDATHEALEPFVQNARIRVLREDNRGVAAARNVGIQAAKAAVLGMLDADDRWTAAIFEELLPAITRLDSPPIVHGRVRDWWTEGLGPAYEAMDLPAALFRRSLFGGDSVGLFDEGLRRLEDYEWLTRAYDLRIPKRRMECVTLHYQQRPNGLTASAPNPDPLFVRVQRGILARRRLGLAPLPDGFPSVKEYFGVPPSGADRRPPRVAAVASAKQLRRLDPRPFNNGTAMRGFACVRNERTRLPAAIRHQRTLGIREFFVIDNGSSDGTVEWLLAQPDVHVWHTEASFAASRFGTDWMLSLLAEFGTDRWCCVLDADELLVLPGGLSLQEFCEELDHAGANAMLAVMVDLYSRGPLREAVYFEGDDPLDTCQWFDRSVWTQRRQRFYDHGDHESFFGGVRQRVFGAPTKAGQPDDGTYFTLNKVPLFRYDATMHISPSFHWIENARMTTGRGAILHWKFTADLADAAVRETSRSEHWSGASQYRRYADALTADPAFTLFDPTLSVKYSGPAQLVELGVMEPVAASQLQEARP